jgi:hypothetical protein
VVVLATRGGRFNDSCDQDDDEEEDDESATPSEIHDSDDSDDSDDESDTDPLLSKKTKCILKYGFINDWDTSQVTYE